MTQCWRLPARMPSRPPRTEDWHAFVPPVSPLSLFVLLVAGYFGALHPWLMTWGATTAEQRMTLPGDSFVPSPAAESTRAHPINAPAGEVWRWLIQLGQDRGGFYSYDWLENLF